MTHEHHTARFRDPAGLKGRFIPLRLDDTELPEALHQYQYIDWRKEGAYDQLLKAIRAAKPANAVLYIPAELRSSNFTGRAPQLQAIEEVLRSSNAVAVTQPFAFTGLGGIGKTRTAVEYAFAHLADYDYIFFLHADDARKTIFDYGEIAALLKIGTREKLLEDRVQRVIEWLERSSRWLLIVDNIDRAQSVEALIPKRASGHILITSRLRDLEPLGIGPVKFIPLDRLPDDEARNFLLNESGRSIAGDDNEREAFEHLARSLDGLPLALRQAAVFIRRLGLTFADYRREFERERTRLFADERARLPEYPESVVTTWSISFKRVVEEAANADNARDAAAPDLMYASAFLSPDEIPMDLLIAGKNELGPRVAAAFKGVETGSIAANLALHLLHNFSLIEEKPASRSYRMHRLVQEIIRHGMTPAERSEWAGRVIRLLNRTSGFFNAHYGNWTEHIATSHHVNFVASVILDEWKRADFEFEETATLLTKMGFLLTQMKQFDEATRLLEQALAIREKLFGAQDLRVAETLNYMGDNLTDGASSYDTSRAEQALACYTRALEIRIAKEGPDAAEVAQIHNNIGIATDKFRRFKEAEAHYREALRIWEKGFDQTLIGTGHYNLGVLYDKQGKSARVVEPYYKRAWEKVRTDHMRAQVCLTIGKFFMKERRFKEALDPLVEAERLARKRFGADSPRLEEYKAALADVRETLGMTDPDGAE